MLGWPWCTLLLSGHSAKSCEQVHLPVMTGGAGLIPGRLLIYIWRPDRAGWADVQALGGQEPP